MMLSTDMCLAMKGDPNAGGGGGGGRGGGGGDSDSDDDDNTPTQPAANLLA